MKNCISKPFYDILIEKKQSIEFNSDDKYEIKTENIYDGRIRIYDGYEWYVFPYEDITLNFLIEEVEKHLSNYSIKDRTNIERQKVLLGKENMNLNNFPYEEYDQITMSEKKYLLKDLRDSLTLPLNLYYKDLYMEKLFITEDVTRKYNMSAYGVGIKLKFDEKPTFYSKTYHSYKDIISHKQEIIDYCIMAEEWNNYSKQLSEGNYKVILAPEVTGILVHECFGHVFEADVRYDNDLGERLTNSNDLSINDDGTMYKLGYCPFDDDGIINHTTTIVNNGYINGYLTDRNTAQENGLTPSGNGRCVRLNQNPISRMTNTYMIPTELSKERIFDSFNGIYIITADYGEIDENGNLIIKPSICRTVKNGNLGDYVKFDKLEMDINDVFSSIELIGNDLEFASTLFGGCGKMGQYPLLISQGGPHILINNVNCL